MLRVWIGFKINAFAIAAITTAIALTGCSVKFIPLSSLTLKMPSNKTSFLMTVGSSWTVTPIASTKASKYSVAPALPAGLTLDSTTGTISGTPTIDSPVTTYTETAIDPMTSSPVSVQFQITVYLAPSIAIVGSPFSYIQGTTITPITPTLSSSVAQVTISPALPAGLVMSSSTGVISGTPLLASSTATYTLTGSNMAGATATTTISIQVTGAAAAITYGGSPYIFTTGDTVNIVPTLALGTITISPALTNGLSLDPVTGIISGTATTTLAQTSYTVTATSGVTATATISIQIVAPPTITYTGSPYTFTKGTVVSVTPVTGSTVSVGISPALPGTLAINGATGAITGTPSATSALTTYTVTVTNLAGATATASIQIQINDVAPAITYTGSPFIYTTGDVVSVTPATLSGTITISPTLSNGLSISSTTGMISGTTTTTLATTSYTITATNTTGQTATASISIQIVAPPAISYAASPYVVAAGNVVSISPATSVGLITISPALGNSLSISGTGVISGTATGTIVNTTYTVTATNAAGATTTTSIVIGPNNPIQLVQTAAATTDGSGTVTLPGASTAGDLIAVSAWVSVTQASDIVGLNGTDSFGNNYAVAGTPVSYNDPENGGITYSILLYAKNITVSNNTPVVITLNTPHLQSGDSAYAELTASEFSGVDPTNPLDQFAASSGGSHTSPIPTTTGTTSTTTNAYELVLGSVVATSAFQTTFSGTGGPSFTTLTSLPNSDFTAPAIAGYAIVSSTGSFSASWSASNNDVANYAGYSGMIASFKGAQSASGIAPATKLAITTSSQSKQTHQCSAIVNVKSETAGGIAANVPSDQTVALSGSGLQFYSDSGCTLAISSLTFTSTASTTQSFYFAASTPGTITLTATPSSFTAVTQNETITLAPKTWLGGSGNANWSTAANWSGGVAPVGLDTAIFDGNCTSCNATLDSMPNYVNLTTYSTYTGTITNSATNPDFYFFTLGGGTFNAGAGTIVINHDFVYYPTATFNAQTGTVQLGDSTANSMDITSYGGTPTFNNLHMENVGTMGYAYIVVQGKFYITGDLTIDNATTTSSSTLNIRNSFYGSTNDKIYLAGNLTANTGGGGDGDLVSATIVLNGNNNTQTVTGAAAGILPSLEIAHTGTGGVNLSGTIVIDGSLTHTSGIVNPGTSTVQIGRGDSTWDPNTISNLSAGNMNFYNLILNKQSTSAYIRINDGTYNVANNLTVSSIAGSKVTFYQSSATPIFNLSGNLSLGASGITNYSNSTFNFVGTNAQTVTSSGGPLNPGTVQINKTGGSLSLSSNVNFYNGSGSYSDFIIQQGVVSLSGFGLKNMNNFVMDASATLNCNGGCGATPNACNLGLGDLQCFSFDNSHGGVINP